MDFRPKVRLPPVRACATGVGLDATVSVDLCHQSGLKYLSHGFQTQGTGATVVDLKVRPESTCVPGAIDFRPKVPSTST
jgi:hypothetical protein